MGAMRPWLPLSALLLVTPHAGGAAPQAQRPPTSTAEVSPPLPHGEKGGGEGPPASTPARPTARDVEGTVTSLDLEQHRVTVATDSGPVTFGFDRNTLVYRPGGATVPAALLPGTVLRAGLAPSQVAWWIQLRPDSRPAPEPAARPAGAAPPSQEGAPPPGGPPPAR